MRLFSLWGALVMVLGIVLIPSTRGLYFHIGETEKKCFIEEIPDETILIGNYKVQLFDRWVRASLVSRLMAGDRPCAVVLYVTGIIRNICYTYRQRRNTN